MYEGVADDTEFVDPWSSVYHSLASVCISEPIMIIIILKGIVDDFV